MQEVTGTFMCDDISEYIQNDGSMVESVGFHPVTSEGKKRNFLDTNADKQLMLKHVQATGPGGLFERGKHYQVTIKEVAADALGAILASADIATIPAPPEQAAIPASEQPVLPA